MTARRVFVVALVAWIIVVGLGLGLGPPLTGDEAAYALLARGTDAAWLYRPRGMVALAQLGVAIGGGDLAMRLGSAALSVGFIAAVATLGRRAFGPWVGAWSALVVVSSHAFVLRAPELLGDLPAATCLLVAVVILIAELERADGPRYRLIAAAPACAAAFYLRYGSAPVIALIGAAALVTWWRGAIARPGPVLATIAVLGAMLAPFAAWSVHATGSVTGILTMASDAASNEPVGHGLRQFLFNNTFRMYGVLVPPVLLAGVLAVVRPPPQRRVAWFLAACAIGQVIAIGLVGHDSPRYLFFALAVLIVVGVDAIRRALAALPAGRTLGRWVAGAALALAWLGLAIHQPAHQREVASGLAELVADADAIRADAAGRPCVVAAYAIPQLMWYSGCESVKLGPAPRAPLAPFALPDARRWYTASAPRRPVDPDAVARATAAEAIALPAPSAWWLRPKLVTPRGGSDGTP